MKSISTRLATLSSTLLFIALINPQAAFARLQVFVSIPPQKYIVKQIGGEHVKVNVMVQSGASPHTYEPKPKQMVAITRAKIFFTVGVEFETVWMQKLSASNPAMAVVPTHDNIKKIPIMGHHHEQRGTDDDDDHAGLDPHIWLSPPLVKQQALTVLEALQKEDPSNSSAYKTNYTKFAQELSKLEQELKRIFRNRKNLQFLVFHPSWGYFAQAYGLEQVAIETEGKTPKPAQLKEIIQHAREQGIKVIFAQPQYSSRSARMVAKAIGGEVVFVDPLSENWMDNMRQVAEKFRRALK
jgi:zinc transport system substrate-binding protein